MGRILDTIILREQKKALFWWAPKAGINMGDELSRVIVSAVLATRDKTLLSERHGSGRLLAIGSILHFSQAGDTVWGSGINGKRPYDALTFDGIKFKSVRGPKTKAILESKGISVPDVFGDPGLLAPLFMAPTAFAQREPEDFLVVPHLNEDFSKYREFEDKLVLPNLGPGQFIERLLSAKLVISSSLHGVILAEAYGIPAVYYDSGSGEHIFKYDDYYSGTGREHWQYGRSVEECLEIGGQEAFDLADIQRKLLSAFPWELWK